MVIPQRAWRCWHEQPETANYLHQGFLAELESLHAAGRLILEDEGVIVSGIGVRWVGGHSPCSQFLYVSTAKGVVLFTGDAVQMYGNVEHHDPIGIWYNEEECWRALQIAAEEPDLLLPGHDPRVLEKYPDGIVA